jgi:hypothetical protein
MRILRSYSARCVASDSTVNAFFTSKNCAWAFGCSDAGPRQGEGEGWEQSREWRRDETADDGSILL